MFAAAVRSLSSDSEVLELPAWASLPNDQMPPSRGLMRARMAALRRLVSWDGGARLLIASDEPCTGAQPEVAAGERIDPDLLRAWLLDLGYAEDDRVDEPGDVAFRGTTIDQFAAYARDAGD